MFERSPRKIYSHRAADAVAAEVVAAAVVLNQKIILKDIHTAKVVAVVVLKVKNMNTLMLMQKETIARFVETHLSNRVRALAIAGVDKE